MLKLIRERWLAALLLALFAALATWESLHASASYDEPVFIATGYYQLKTQDFSLNPTHPPLNNQLSALPLLLMKPQPTFPYDNPDCAAKKHWECTEAFVNANKERFGQILLLSRLPHIVLGVLLGALILMWASQLYGNKAGLLGLALYSFSPVFLSFTGLALYNNILAFFVLLTAYAFWRYTKTGSLKLLALTGVFFGLALATEFAAILLLPIFAIHAAKRLRFGLQNCLLLAALIAVPAFVVLFASYGFQFSTLPESVPAHYSDYASEKAYPKLENLPVVGKPALLIVEKVPIPFASFWSGFAWQYVQTKGDYKANFFAGKVYHGANLSQGLAYFFLNVLFKTPIPLIILFAAGLYALWKGREKIKASGEWILLLLPLVFLLFAISSGRNTGPNHILPLYAAIIIIASKAATLKNAKGSRLLKAGAILLLAWYITGTLSAAPHFTSYFNELLPAEKSYKLFSDSSNDIGTELKHLATYLKGKEIGKVKLSYFGSVNPSLYGINYDYLASPRFQAWIPDPSLGGEPVSEACGPSSGILAVSITNINEVHLTNRSCYEWLEPHRPIAYIGNSILVYNIS